MTFRTTYSPSDFNYDLPQEFIAQYPLHDRSASKLLYFDGSKISHQGFRDLPELLSEGASLFFNDTRVFPARTFFKKKSGSVIQIFLLEPLNMDVQVAMSQQDNVIWECIIGNLKKWKSNEKLTTTVNIDGTDCIVDAHLLDREKKMVRFEWNGEYTFSKVIHALGKVPLPPYIKRDSEKKDLNDYQTVYAKQEGAVAAPTAGLHFTRDVLEELKKRDIGITYLTLHVGAGTFQPLQAENVMDHDMHSEHFEVSTETLLSILNNSIRFAVGTTSLRTLESLYWAGVKISRSEDPTHIEKFYPYDNPSEITYEESIGILLKWMIQEQHQTFRGSTAIMIMPGYSIRSIKGLITNFHMPQSTLIMLVAAFIGQDWRTVYEEALSKGYRFLSYGDSSLLIRK